LLSFYRSAEARGEIRGGRFVEPLGGEQFALIEAVEELRRLRRTKGADEWLVLSVADPLNLTGVVAAPARIAAAPSRRLALKNGVPVAAETSAGIEWRAELTMGERQRVAELFVPGAPPPEPQPRFGWRRR
jgi:ATP-dependent Lhr-like helicase